MECDQQLLGFGRDFAIFDSYNVPPLLYSLAFGGILPLVSLMLARILANTIETEAGANPELAKAKQTIKHLRSDLKTTEQYLADAKARASVAKQRFGGAGGFLRSTVS
jgi:hypothetical protein